MSSAAPSPQVAKPDVVLPPAGEAGAAYLKTSRGIVVVGADGAASFSANAYVSALQLGADGHAYASAWEHPSETATVSRLEGTRTVKVASLKKYPIDAFAVAQDGTVFASAHVDELHTFRSGKATKEVLAGVDGIKRLVTTSTSLIVQTGKGIQARPLATPTAAWAPVQVPAGAGTKDGCVAPGQLWLVGGPGPSNVFGLDAASAALRPIEVVQDAVYKCWAAPTGLVAIGDYDGTKRSLNALLLSTPAGGARRVPFAPRETDAAALDGAGRLWSIREGKLSVVGPDSATTYELGTVPGLRDLAGQYDHAVAVVGAGPKLPVPTAPQMMTVKGKLARGGPLANIPIELCKRPRPASGTSSSCTVGGRQAFSTTTDAAGAFSLNVPLDSFAFTYRDRGWAELLDANVSPKETARAGAVLDLGTIRLK